MKFNILFSFKFLYSGFLVCNLIAVPSGYAAKPEIQKKPNVLLVITDDQRWDAIRANGVHDWLQTPNMDKLAKEGVMFTQAFCQAPLCAASRTAIFSGRYPHRSGVYGFENVPDKSSYIRPWIADVMGANGYDRALFGKDGSVLRNQNATNGKWESQGLAHYPDGYNDLGYYKKQDPEPKPKVWADLGVLTRKGEKTGGVIIAGRHPNEAGKTIDAYIAFDALKYIGSRSGNIDNPFFLTVGFNFPHTPVLVPAPFDKLYDPDKMVIPEFTEDENSKISPQVQKAIKNFKFENLTNDEIKKTIAHYYAYNTYGDGYLGKVVDSFKAQSKAEGREWLIILVSDNGWHMGEHNMNAKFTFYDISTHLPLIVSSSDKRFPKNVRFENLVEFVDIAPTILGAAGIEIPEYMNGIDLYKSMNSKKPLRNEVISEEFHVMSRGMVRGFYKGKLYVFSMRTRPNSFILNQQMDWVKTAPDSELDIHLFDMEKDPLQVNNVAEDSGYKAIVADFKQRFINRLFTHRVEPIWKNTIKQRGEGYGSGNDDDNI